jgi:hypothetical protein
VRPSEACWIAAQFAALPAERLSPLINVGSSTAEFREQRQPHIDRLVFGPLRAARVDVIHSDLKAAPGVDVAGDLMDAGVQAALRARRPGALLCSNLLEHVRSPAQVARAMTTLLGSGGVIVVTVPFSYPYHADPIDTGFRPTPAELAALFPGCDLVCGEIIEDTTYGRDLLAGGFRGMAKGIRGLVGALRPSGDLGRAQRDRLRWLFRPFSTTGVVLEVRG